MIGPIRSQSRVFPSKLTILFLTAIQLLPWFPYLWSSIHSQVLQIPTYGEDETHYITRLASIWQGHGPGFALSAFTFDKFQIVDGFNTILERIFFSWGALFQDSRLLFVYFLFFVIAISLLIVSKQAITFSNLIFPNFHSRLLALSISTTLLLVSFFTSLRSFDITHMTESIRFPVPMLHFGVLFFLLSGILREEFHKLKYGAIIGISSFLYFYTWIQSIAILFIAYLISLKRKQNLARLTPNLIFSILLSSPTIISLISSHFYPDEMNRVISFAFGLEKTHSVKWSLSISILLISTLCSHLLAEWKPEYSNFRLLNLVVTLVSVLTYNQQVLTGRVLQIGHFHWYFIYPFSLVFLFCWTWILVRHKLVKLSTPILVVPLLLALANSTSTSFVNLRTLNSENNLENILIFKEMDSLALNRNIRIISFDPSLERLVAINPKVRLGWHEFGIHYSQDVQSIYDINVLIWKIRKNPNALSIGNILNSCVGDRKYECYSFFSLLGSNSKYSYSEFVKRWNLGKLSEIDFERNAIQRLSKSFSYIDNRLLLSKLQSHQLQYVAFPEANQQYASWNCKIRFENVKLCSIQEIFDQFKV